jgi:hypothetical protein
VRPATGSLTVMVRLIVILALAAGLAYVGATVKLGNRTFFGHIRAIWATEEVQDLKHGVEEKAGPAVEKVKRGVKAGIEAAEKDEPKGSGSAGSGSATAAPAN